MQLREFRATGRLAQLIGGKVGTFSEIRSALFDWAQEHALLTDKRVRVDTELSFLAPGRKYLSYYDFVKTVGGFVVRVEGQATEGMMDEGTALIHDTEGAQEANDIS